MSSGSRLPGGSGTSRMSAETERLLARLVMDGAAQLAERASTQGVTAYLRKPLVRGRPNERFLQSTLRNVTTSNRRVDESLMWELRESQKQREDGDRSESPAHGFQAGSSSTLPGNSPAPSEGHKVKRRHRSKGKRGRSPHAQSTTTSRKRSCRASPPSAADVVDEPGASSPTRSFSKESSDRPTHSGKGCDDGAREAAQVAGGRVSKTRCGDGDDVDGSRVRAVARGASGVVDDSFASDDNGSRRRKKKRKHKHRTDKHAGKKAD